MSCQPSVRHAFDTYRARHASRGQHALLLFFLFVFIFIFIFVFHPPPFTIAPCPFLSHPPLVLRLLPLRPIQILPPPPFWDPNNREQTTSTAFVRFEFRWLPVSTPRGCSSRPIVPRGINNGHADFRGSRRMVLVQPRRRRASEASSRRYPIFPSQPERTYLCTRMKAACEESIVQTGPVCTLSPCVCADLSLNFRFIVSVQTFREAKVFKQAIRPNGKKKPVTDVRWLWTRFHLIGEEWLRAK